MEKDKLKEGLTKCMPGKDCAVCPYFTEGCYESLHKDAFKRITQQDHTIAVLMELNQKLAQELQNSLDLSKGGEG